MRSAILIAALAGFLVVESAAAAIVGVAKRVRGAVAPGETAVVLFDPGDPPAGTARWTPPDRAAAPAGGVTLTAAQCDALRREAGLGADFVPGQDVYGRSVAPADLAGGAEPDFTITLTLDALRAAGIVAPVAGLEGETRLGDIRIEGGRAYLGGTLLDPEGTDSLRRLCREKLNR